MNDELNLVHDLAVILISAGVFTIISKALKQPLVLGYIVAGFLVGPNVSFFPGISSTESVSQWSELGIIFLLFGLGLEFSFKKLLKVGSTALVMAGCQFLGMMALGIMLAQAMGWSTMESIFLGGMLSMSSTAIVIKAYDDLNLKKAPYAPTVFGTLVVQDLIAILLMVILSTMAVSNSFSGLELLKGIGKLIFFIILWFLVGIDVIPTLLQKAKKYMNDEIMLIIGVGMCFGMVMIANAVGFSSALGAFVMGSILSETVEGEKIMNLVGSIKNLFSAVFFVSVGMMLDPSVVAEHWCMVLVITILALVGMSFFSGSGALLSGKGINYAVSCGFSMAQVGEFSFILAGLGVSLGVMSGFIYPVIIAVSVITTFITPYMIKLAPHFARFLHKRLPERIVERLDSAGDGESADEEHSEVKGYVRAQMVRVGLYGVVALAILLGSNLVLEKVVDAVLPDISEGIADVICVAITLVVMIPFLMLMVTQNQTMRKTSHELLRNHRVSVWLLLTIDLMKMAVAIVFIFMVLASHFNLNAWEVLLIVAATSALFYFFIRIMYHRISRIEARFMQNLNKKEDLRRQKAPVATSVSDNLSRYDVSSVTVEVSPDYPGIGHKLGSLQIRRNTGVNIIKISRGSRNIELPSGEERVYPYDKLLAVGTSQQLSRFEEYMSLRASAGQSSGSEFSLDKIVLDATSEFIGKSVRELDLRPSGRMVISVARDGKSIANPDPGFVFREGDLVWTAHVN